MGIAGGDNWYHLCHRKGSLDEDYPNIAHLGQTRKQLQAVKVSGCDENKGPTHNYTIGA